jgi:6-phosphogluconate dehydrogenase (decarboxylating)
MNLGFDQPLYILPFDHRGSFQTKMFGWTGKLILEQTAQIAATKQVIYDAFKAAIAAGVPKEKAGIDPTLSQFAECLGFGQGRWTIKAAIDESIPAPVLSTALYQRFTSRGEADYQDRLLSAMRFGFGGQLEKAASK